MPAFQSSSRISVYLSMPTGEISTRDIVGQAIDMGKQVFVPYIGNVKDPKSGRQAMDMLALHSRTDLDGLQPDGWGIPTLSGSSVQHRENGLGGVGISVDDGPEVDGFKGLDLVLIPGLGFDIFDGRLGHGKGFYDQFLERYSQRVGQEGGPVAMPLLGMLFLLFPLRRDTL